MKKPISQYNHALTKIGRIIVKVKAVKYEY